FGGPFQHLDQPCGAVDPDAVTGADAVPGVLGVHHARYAHLPRQDRRVAQRRPDVDDHTAGDQEERRPGGVGRLADEDLAVGQLVGVVWVGDHPGQALHHPWATPETAELVLARIEGDLGQNRGAT